MRYGLLFSCVGALLWFVAAQQGGYFWLAAWPALSFQIVGIGYLGMGAKVFAKRHDGTHELSMKILLLPYLALCYVVWFLFTKIVQDQPFHQLTEHVWIGRRLFPYEYPAFIECVLDLTSEFSGSRPNQQARYLSLPILDAESPTDQEVTKILEQITNETENIYIHCAQGRGRTGLLAAILLFHKGEASTPEEALAKVKQKRACVRLSPTQAEYLRLYMRKGA